MILVFGGTTEGRAAVETLEEAGQTFYYSTRGALQQMECAHAVRLTGGMEAGEMAVFCRDRGIRLLVDAAHPFAEQLHRNIAAAADELDLPVIRYERSYPPRDPALVWCDSYADACAALERRGVRNLLALSGVQTIPRLKEYWAQHPCWFRVLDRDESRALAARHGFPADRLVYFDESASEEALLRTLRPDAVLTKESGESGYFCEKVAAAQAMGIPVFVIKRPALPGSFYVVTGRHGLRHRVERLVPGFFPLAGGYTTGACATAAARAALLALLTGERCDRVAITLPCGESVELPVARVERTEGGATATVVKDAGDDPDVTHGREVCACVALSDAPGVRFRAGDGVGTVTLPGLGLAVGEPAINPVPRRMMAAECESLLAAHAPGRGVEIEISVPGGAELAQRTFNPRLGIVGGISIIGTSGIVRPFSSEAFVATIRKEVQVARALGCRHLVVNSGAKSERALRARFPDLPAQAFVHYGNYIGDTLRIAAVEGIPRLTMGIMIGKAVKLAEGHPDTHSRSVVMNRSFVADLAARAGCAPDQCARIAALTLARELWTLLPPAHPFFSLLVERCLDTCRTFYPDGELEVILIPESE